VRGRGRSPQKTNCPFCEPNSARIFYEGSEIVCLWDGYPVSAGHALVVTRRHLANWFETSSAEQVELLEGVERASYLR